ncbi:hypothetical protein LOK49_LG12G01958 [Camellia lanceoleosa]|uniref:Uncharacterized protein n=1 Tax=Camellia lanceoleosa TaxID=1840588 RepID=A0ACC0FVU7_9ERIC|nr:hypothetical protein LOK49_LG12G01958 [Camellia lanceoleosa]
MYYTFHKRLLNEDLVVKKKIYIHTHKDPHIHYTYTDLTDRQ